MLTKTRTYDTVIPPAFSERITAMAVYISIQNMISAVQRAELVQISPRLYCRTQIST